MFYKDRIRNIVAAYPKLSAIWIKTEDERLPLEQVWINESQLFTQPERSEVVAIESETIEQSEDHLALVG